MGYKLCRTQSCMYTLNEMEICTQALVLLVCDGGVNLNTVDCAFYLYIIATFQWNSLARHVIWGTPSVLGLLALFSVTNPLSLSLSLSLTHTHTHTHTHYTTLWWKCMLIELG